jgi:hypothetical protein
VRHATLQKSFHCVISGDEQISRHALLFVRERKS